jgi:hypothetical protein
VTLDGLISNSDAVRLQPGADSGISNAHIGIRRVQFFQILWRQLYAMQAAAWTRRAIQRDKFSD